MRIHAAVELGIYVVFAFRWWAKDSSISPNWKHTEVQLYNLSSVINRLEYVFCLKTFMFASKNEGERNH